MTMRIIDSTQTGNSAPIQTGRTGQAAPVETGRGASRGAGISSDADSVELSSFSGRLTKALGADAAARSERVSRIAAAVQSGSYKVDSAALSNAIVSDALSMSGPR